MVNIITCCVVMVA